MYIHCAFISTYILCIHHSWGWFLLMRFTFVSHIFVLLIVVSEIQILLHLDLHQISVCYARSSFPVIYSLCQFIYLILSPFFPLYPRYNFPAACDPHCCSSSGASGHTKRHPGRGGGSQCIAPTRAPPPSASLAPSSSPPAGHRLELHIGDCSLWTILVIVHREPFFNDYRHSFFLCSDMRLHFGRDHSHQRRGPVFSVQLVSTPSAEAILFVVVKPPEALRLFAILEPYPKSVLQPTANRSVIHVNSQLTAALKENGHIIISFSTVF